MLSKIRFLFILLVVNTTNIIVNAQNKDSLLLSLVNERNDSIKIEIYLKLARAFINDSTDTAGYYYQKGIELSEKINQINQVYNLQVELSDLYRKLFIYDKAIIIASEAINTSLTIGDSLLVTTSYSNLGNIYLQMEFFQKALENLYNASKYLDPERNPRDAGKIFGRIGNIYLMLEEEYNLAEEYYNKAIKYFEKSNAIQGVIIATQNLGVIEKRRKNYSRAIEYYNTAIKSYETINNPVGIASCLANIGNIYYEKGNYELALRYQQNALITFKKYNVYNDIILCYAEIASSYNKVLKPKLAIENLKIALNLNSKFGNENQTLMLIYNELKIAYLHLGDTIKAFKFLDLYSVLNDSITYRDSRSRIDMLKTQFNVAQKEYDIKLLTTEKALNEAKIKRKNAFQILYWIVIFFSLVSLTTLYFLLRTKQKSNRLLTLKNAEILQQKEEIESQRDEIEAQKEEIETQRDDLEVQRSIAVRQRDEIMKQKQHMTDSISYAKHIQTALLPNDNEVRAVLHNYFVFFNPLDIVSGDFYWVSNKNGKSIIAVADCTGHGVPGALMSVMGINFLSGIVDERNVSDPGQILTILNENVIAALSHADGCMQDKDGMDISLCCIDYESKTISYACARNRMLIWRDGGIIQLEADKYSIGKSPFVDKMVYQTFTHQMQVGDMLYLLTDGYVDQFGGLNKTKFLTSRFKRLLMQIGSLEPSQQNELLDQNITNWMGNSIQIDDMLIVGIRV